MSAPAAPQFHQLEPHAWTVAAGGGKQEYVTPFITNFEKLGLDPDSVTPSLILLGGNGEGRGSLANALGWLAEQGISAIAPVVEVDHIPGDRVKAEGFVRSFGREVIGAAQDRTNPGKKAVVVGHSMGGTFAGITLEEAPGLIDGLGLAEPACTTTLALRQKYPDATEAQLVMMARLARVATNPIYPARMSERLLATYELYSQIGHDIASIPPGHTLWEKFSLVPNNDILPLVLDHAEENTVVLGVGARDPLIRPDELVVSIAGHIDQDPERYTPKKVTAIASNLKIVRHPHGSHMHLASDRGRQNLTEMTQHIVQANMRHKPAPAQPSMPRRLFRLAFGTNNAAAKHTA